MASTRRRGAVADRLADGAHAGLVHLGREPDLEVQRPEPLGHPGEGVLDHPLRLVGHQVGVEAGARPPGAAPQPVQRLPEDATRQIPQRGVDARQRPRHTLCAQVRHAGLGVQPAPDQVVVERIGPDYQRRHRLDHRGRHRRAAGPHHRRLADARQTLVGDELDQHGLERVGAVAAASPAGAVGALLRHGHRRGAELDDLHANTRGGPGEMVARRAATRSARWPSTVIARSRTRSAGRPP